MEITKFHVVSKTYPNCKYHCGPLYAIAILGLPQESDVEKIISVEKPFVTRTVFHTLENSMRWVASNLRSPIGVWDSVDSRLKKLLFFDNSYCAISA